MAPGSSSGLSEFFTLPSAIRHHLDDRLHPVRMPRNRDESFVLGRVRRHARGRAMAPGSSSGLSEFFTPPSAIRHHLDDRLHPVRTPQKSRRINRLRPTSAGEVDETRRALSDGRSVGKFYI